MSIFILIVLCWGVVQGLASTVVSLVEKKSGQALIGITSLVAFIVAVIFYSRTL